MIDPDGAEWLTVTAAARAVRVRPSAIWNWCSRGKVRRQRLGRIAWVHMGDVRAAEHAWRKRMTSV
ncbi:hypothetical protein GCM10025865_01060 [Paraoerskovia sediminicola]|uniref:Helix-turn-helix domain-containing protein n=1 Tax=Paraoerskovia sediminicola TaxID=1138587 RepID=A0ABN6X7U5_9CELL|nr:hypothetical protein GCM10025865_01060 [Paraoerskovia sediminicola]